MMFGDEPTVVQDAFPSEESISTRTVAAGARAFVDHPHLVVRQPDLLHLGVEPDQRLAQGASRAFTGPLPSPAVCRMRLATWPSALSPRPAPRARSPTPILTIASASMSRPPRVSTSTRKSTSSKGGT